MCNQFKIVTTAVIAAVVLSFSACNTQKAKPSFNWDMVKWKSSFEFYPASSFFQKVAAIPLYGLPHDIFLTKIKEVQFAGDYFFVTIQGANPLLVFNKDGQFLRKIGSVGQGPEEFSEITSYTIAAESRRVFIYDQWLAKILVFDFEGDFKMERSDIISRYIFFHNDILYGFKAYNGNLSFQNAFADAKQIQILDGISLEIMDSFLAPSPTGLGSEGDMNIFHTREDTVVIHPPGAFELIYLLNGKIVKHDNPIIGPAFPNNEERVEQIRLILSKEPLSAIKFLSEKEKFSVLNGAFKFSDGRFLGFVNPGGINTVFFFKNGIYTHAQWLLDDITSFDDTWQPMSFRNDKLIAVIQSENVDLNYLSDSPEELIDELEDSFSYFAQISKPRNFKEKFLLMVDKVQSVNISNDEPTPVILIFQ